MNRTNPNDASQPIEDIPMSNESSTDSTTTNSSQPSLDNLLTALIADQHDSSISATEISSVDGMRSPDIPPNVKFGLSASNFDANPQSKPIVDLSYPKKTKKSTHPKKDTSKSSTSTDQNSLLDSSMASLDEQSTRCDLPVTSSDKPSDNEVGENKEFRRVEGTLEEMEEHKNLEAHFDCLDSNFVANPQSESFAETSRTKKTKKSTHSKKNKSKSSTSTDPNSLLDFSTASLDEQGTRCDLPVTSSDKVNKNKGGKKKKFGWVEHTLEEMGYSLKNMDDDKSVQQLEEPEQPFFNEKIAEMIIKNELADYVVKIGDESFKVHSSVLCCHSEKFLNDSNSIELDPEKVSLETFKICYNWMIFEDYELKPNTVLDVYQAAEHMEVTDLITECWRLFEDRNNFYEHRAFKVYFHAHRRNLKEVEMIMLQRIRKYFLSLVASSYFNQLSFDQVKDLLSSNYIGVNVETEIFFTAVYWLNCKWNERKEYAVDLMKAVRFDCIPIMMLVVLNREIDLERQVERVISIPENQQKAYNAITKNTISLCYANSKDVQDSMIHLFPGEIRYIPKDRFWIYDKKCSYHLPRSSVNQKKPFLYKEFLDYLAQLRTYGHKHWVTLLSSNDVDDIRETLSEKDVPINVERQSRETQREEISSKSSMRAKSLDTEFSTEATSQASMLPNISMSRAEQFSSLQTDPIDELPHTSDPVKSEFCGLGTSKMVLEDHDNEARVLFMTNKSFLKSSQSCSFNQN